ncbi:hypothetical protein INR49_001174 [Caranx melampygus]|nr:hypothetical protein INR49_001174 [Caranx melampygus]
MSRRFSVFGLLFVTDNNNNNNNNNNMSVSLLWTLLVLVGLLSSAGSHSQLDIAARPGQNVTLPCQAPNRSPIRAAEWSRPDLGSEYVFFYRDDQQDKTQQHESFKDRVELVDRQLKDGDLSLILIMARPSDTGRYECRVKQEVRRKRAVIRAEPVSIVNLTVVRLQTLGMVNTCVDLLDSYCVCWFGL